MSRLKHLLLSVLLIFAFLSAKTQSKELRVDFFTDIFLVKVDSTLVIRFPSEVSDHTLHHGYEQLNAANFHHLIDSLLLYKKQHELNDWLYYQLVRRVAQQLSPKEVNYAAYTLYKWFMLVKSGYDARLALSHQKIIFYVCNDEDIEDIPFFMIGNKKYMCLNYHDYARINLNDDPPVPVKIDITNADQAFSYKVTRMPDFKPAQDIEKKLEFVYDRKAYHFSIKLNTNIQAAFANYPGVDFESYFNIPMTRETYSSLIPLLKKNVARMSEKKGVDYLMRFTRYAFLYENDQENFGKEKRMSPQETLMSAYSDCDDRAALFFYLVKEIYNLPMIALLYPTHITMAVEFRKPIGEPILYKGKVYSLCEPTPELEDLGIGQMSAQLKNIPYRIVYQYEPH